MANVRTPLLQPAINGDVEAQNPVTPNPGCLAPVKKCLQEHNRAIKVIADGVAPLALFQAVNNNLQGWPDTYYKNLITLNIAFAGYYVVQLGVSSFYHHSHNEEMKATLGLATASLFLFTVTMMSYIFDSLEDDLTAGQAQVTDAEGGSNNVSSNAFWAINFGIPFIIAFLYSASQFGKGMHQILTDRGMDPLQPLHSRIHPGIKKAFKVTDKIATFAVESLAVNGALIQDLAYYSLSYAGVNLLNDPQYATTLLYGGGAVAGMAITGLFRVGIAPKVISELNFGKLVLGTGGLLGTSVFYTSNIADTQQNGVNTATMISMAGLPALMVGGGIVYTIRHQCKKHKRNKDNAVIEPVTETGSARELPALPHKILMFGGTSSSPKNEERDQLRLSAN